MCDLRPFISLRRLGAGPGVLPHLGVELLPTLPLSLQFFLRLLEASADEFHLRLAALQLHGQLAVCAGRGRETGTFVKFGMTNQSNNESEFFFVGIISKVLWDNLSGLG